MQTILKSRLLAAPSFKKNTLLKHLSSERSSVNWPYMGADLLRKSDNALEDYTFLSKLANKNHDNAVESHKHAEEQFTKTQKLVETTSATFKASVEVWKKEQKGKAAKDILWAIAGVGTAITVTILTASSKY
jgi:hypothetical protein